MSANYLPNLNTYTDLKPFRFWCQKVLPLAYDDSLSYYELLNKVVDYLNKTMEDVTLSIEDVQKLHTAYEQLQTYVNDYFDNLDVQEEINNKLDSLVENGTIHDIFNDDVEAILSVASQAAEDAIEAIPSNVTAWLDTHVTPESDILIDSSLTIDGAAADAKVTGDEIRALKSDLNEKANLPYDETPIIPTISTAKVIKNDGTIGNIATGSTNYTITNNISVTPGQYYKIKASTNYGNSLFAFYDVDDNPVYIETTVNDGSTFKYYDGIVIAPENASTLIVGCQIRSEVTSAYAANIDYIDVDLKPIPSVANADRSATPGSIWTATDNGSKWNNTIPQIVENNFTPTYGTITGSKESGKWINTSGIVGDITPTAWNVTTYSVEGGKTYLISGCAYGVSYVFAFYDQSDAFISGLNGDTGGQMNSVYNHLIVAPSGSVTLRVTAYDGRIDAKVETTTGVINNAERPWRNKKWVVFGDSLTEYNSRTDKHYFDYIAEKTGINIVNMGDSGSGYRREYDGGTAFYQRIGNVPLDADVITIFGSFNDMGVANYQLGTETDTTTDTIAGCINTTLDNLFNVYPLAVVGIVTPTPWVGYNSVNTSAAAMEKAKNYVNMIVSICKRRGIPCLNLYENSLLRPWEQSFRELAYTKDDGNGVHPDETGHKMIAPRFESFLNSLLLR